MLSAAATTARVNSSRDPVRTTWSSSHGMTRVPTTSINATNPATLIKVSASGRARLLQRHRAAIERRGKRRQDDQRPDHEQVFDDQPADRDAAIEEFEHPALFERAQHHDRAGDRQCQAKDDAGANRPAPQFGDADAERAGDRDLRDRPRHGNTPDGEQVADREMHADPEHQQHDADFGELWRQMRVGDITRGERADRDTGQQITDDRRQRRAGPRQSRR